MFESVDKMMLAGLGALSMSRERAEKIFDEYVKRGEVERGARSGFVKELMDTAEKTREDLEKVVAGQVQKAVERLDLATKEDIYRVEKKLDELLSSKE